MDKEYFAKKQREYRKADPERYRKTQQTSYQKHREKRLTYQREASKTYRLNNKKLIQAKDSIRHLQKKNRVPSWANLEEIKRIYGDCPDNLVVDHIIPLRGKTVSGLHVEYNLQYLTPEENYRKNNIYPHSEFH